VSGVQIGLEAKAMKARRHVEDCHDVLRTFQFAEAIDQIEVDLSIFRSCAPTHDMRSGSDDEQCAIHAQMVGVEKLIHLVDRRASA